MLTPVLAVTSGRGGALAGGALAVPMLAKRVLGNRVPAAPRGAVTWRTYAHRLVFDHDPRAEP
jgi:hypothetical protein